MLLSVENLRVSYGEIKALHGISFQIEEGEIVCIIGANGAGKSTTLRAISRLLPAEPGTKMIYKGDDLQNPLFFGVLHENDFAARIYSPINFFVLLQKKNGLGQYCTLSR